MTDQPELAVPDDLPGWLLPVAEAANAIEGTDLTAFLPPPGSA